MAGGKEYTFSVDVDDDQGQPFGPVSKENLDVARLITDFTCWLDPGEGVGAIDFISIYPNPAPTPPSWQQDYPLDDQSGTVPPPDTYPPEVIDYEISVDGKRAILTVNAGSPGLTYVVSFTATGSSSQRRRQVDILLMIDWPLNPEMVGPSDVVPVVTPPLVIGMTSTVPEGYKGRIYVENGSNGPITITLPPNPHMGDVVSPVDINLNADQYPITYQGAAGSLIYSSNTFTTDVRGDDLSFEWTGSHWIVLTNRFGFLG